MNNNMAGYDNFKRILAFVMGLVILGTSLYFSVEGFDFKVQNANIWWVGWVLAFAVTSSQFMFNTRPKELNWTIIILGLVAYGYSIWSNIMGFYALRGTPSVYDWMNISGGIFMDVFPETAIAWSLGAIKAGDLFGNLFSVIGNPDTVSNSQPPMSKSHQPQSPMDKLPKPIVDNYPSSFGKGTLHPLVNKQDGRHNKK
jgi:hypothetical protein